MNILIIEESKTIAQLISKSLSAQGFNITLDDSGFTNEVFVKKGLFEIVVLNTNLPKDRTKRIIEKVKALNINIKILGICSLGGWKDKVSFLKDGGDDVVSYPFPIQELVARIWSLQRRPRSYIDEKLYIGEYLLSHLEQDEVILECSESVKPGVFKVKDDESFIHLVMPMML